MTLNEFIIRIAIVILVGIVIGIERQLTGHHIGIKTTMLISLGSFAFIMTEVILGENDMRMAANVITGIGFLCGSVIFKNGLTINGLNTSATLWSTAGISVLITYGLIWEGIIAALVLVVFNMILNKASALIKPIKFLCDDTESSYTINVVCLKSDIQKVKEIILDNLDDNVDLVELQVNTITNDKNRIKARIETTKKQIFVIEKITNMILNHDVLSASWEKFNG